MASSWLKPPTYHKDSSGGGRIRTTSKAEGEEKAGYKNRRGGRRTRWSIFSALRVVLFLAGVNTYWRLAYRHGLPDAEVKRYGLKAYEISTSNPCDSFYPEWVVQQFDDKDWMTEIPSPSEAGVYWVNGRYVKKLIAQLGDSTGHALETLAEYILSCMPGCRTTKRKRTSASELDIVCSVEGIEADFRSEFGRYFVCECKDWKKVVDFTTIAKFCRVLDSIKLRFGILFLPRGISGSKGTKFAERERLKVFQDRGIVLVVVNKQDLDSVAEGKNFISLLRREYERVRLDLPPSKAGIRHS